MSETVVILRLPTERVSALFESEFGEGVLFFAVGSEERFDRIVGEAAAVTEESIRG